MNEKYKSCMYLFFSLIASCYSGRQSVTDTDDDYELSIFILFYQVVCAHI